jgi:hypothetical protein
MTQEKTLGYLQLTTPYRYPDLNFFALLLRCRVGAPSPADIAILKERVKAYKTLELNLKKGVNEIIPTRLYSKKINVNALNDAELEKLPEPSYFFRAVDKLTPVDKKRM